MAERLRHSGARVVALDLTADNETGVRSFNVTDSAQWHAIATDLAADGSLHGLVNCAGITRRSRLQHVTDTDMLDVYRVNLLAPLLGIQALTTVMVPGSSIVNIGSMAGLTAHYPVAYTTSKWALRGLTRTAAMELGERGIRVNIIHPGFIDTPMSRSAPKAFLDASLGLTSLGRMGVPEDVAATVEFLLSDSAGFITGVELTVDGGASSHGGAKSISGALRETGD
ncbi:SDR family NAD(P)-dependent oxidoreductase [Nocardia aobensis]|uniref:SDR family NAD(P)-dependent oxidoreductase n=1 Tax=Nocardia aobensis TaxID=257277 RepID=A0ABW6PFA5_9NOCA